MATLTIGNEAAEGYDGQTGEERYAKPFDVRDVGYCATQLAYVNRNGVAAPLGSIGVETTGPVFQLGPENHIG